MAGRPVVPGLHALARLHGVQTAYYDTTGRRVVASADSLLAALAALGVVVRDAGRVPELLRDRERDRWGRAVEPVVVRWVGRDGRTSDPNGSLRLRLPVRLRDRPVRFTVLLEGGGETTWKVDPGSLRRLEEAEVDGVLRVALEAPVPDLPPGYHDLVVEAGSGALAQRHEALLIAAPLRARGWDVLARERAWGLFAPLYALHRSDDRPALPDRHVPAFGDLADLAERVARRGGSVVGTLPLLAAFLGDHPYDPSPYAPVSRLFWNELYADPVPAAERLGIADIEAFAAYAVPPIRPALFEREEGPEPLGEMRFHEDRRVDPQVGMRLRRVTLEALAARFFRAGPPAELEAFRASSPRADDYAIFRSLTATHGPWPRWPDRLRARDIRRLDYDRGRAQYHLFVQWLATVQLADARDRAAADGVGLYLDLPLGVHPDGYDVWRERELFATTASAGAPPDGFAPDGQDWGFPPLDPEASRSQGHRYLIECIRTHLRFARVLRIDHVMQLHRMYWVPAGDAREGVYIRYPAKELYAILALESRRAGALIVGEDLGTVPRAVRRGMRRHGLPGMYVVQFELEDTLAPSPGGQGWPALVPRPVPRHALASIGTHDTPTFAGWWFGRDIELRRDRGALDPEDAETELRGRAVMREKLIAGLLWDADGNADGNADGDEEEVARRVQGALLRRLGASPAGLVLATLEDLWLEREPQNVPGTAGEWNWRRRSARPQRALDEPEVAALLDALNEARKGTG